MKRKELSVYYDGLCKICDKEMRHYRKQKGAESIEFIDICSPSFDAKQENLDPFEIHKTMHARKRDGTVVTRVSAFVAIWELLPRYQWLAKIAQLKIIKAGMEIGYSGFIRVRPFLPRYAKIEDCQSSPYCELKKG